MPDYRADRVCTPKAIEVAKKEVVRFPERSYAIKDKAIFQPGLFTLGLYYFFGSTFQAGESVTGVNDEVCVIQDKLVIVN